MRYPKPNPGDPLRIPAAAYGFLLETAEAFWSDRNASAAGTLLGWPTTFGKLRNDAGKDLYRWDVVGIDPPLILPTANLATFQRQVQFSGVDPVLARHTGAFAVLLAPLAEDAIGPAIIAGCAVVGITVPAGSGSASGSSGSSGELTWAAMQSEGLVFAEIQETEGFENILAADTAGSARILWCEDQDNEDGWRWAYVRLGAGSGGGSLLRWVSVSSTTVTSGTQPGNLLTYGTWALGAAIRVRQVNGFTLATGKRFLAKAETDDDGEVWATGQQTGLDGTFTVCEPTGNKSYLFENGVLASRA